MNFKTKINQYKNKVFDLVNPENYKRLTNLAEFLEKDLEKDLTPPDTSKPIPVDHIPTNLELRPKGFFRDLYDRLFPVSHVFRITYQHNREFLSDFMPISNEAYIGRGSYKLVYKLPWNHVVKVGKSIFYSDPLFGSLFKEAFNNSEVYLKPDEIELRNFLKSKIRGSSKREAIDFKFARLGMERLHYWKVKGLLPDLVLPTRFYMGLRFRNRPCSEPGSTLTPCDTQPLIPGKHLKEFVSLNEKLKKNPLEDKLFPKWKLNFDLNKFGIVNKSKLKKIAFNFHRVIEATKYLAKEENLILDLHSENIIITLPDFELKIFDYHVFDDHLYEATSNRLSPEEDHIKTIQKFINSFELAKNGE
jgi:hypothetical protein